MFLSAMFFCAKIYRPWIYHLELFDFYIADTYTNLLGVPACFFIFSLFYKSINIKKTLLSIVSVYIIGEIIGWLIGDVFDYKDIIATFVGCGLSFLIYKFSIYVFSEKPNK
jgi:hypothetical protein